MAVELIKTIVAAVIGLFVALAFLSPVAVKVTSAAADGNLSSTDQALVSLITTMFVVAILMIAVNMI